MVPTGMILLVPRQIWLPKEPKCSKAMSTIGTIVRLSSGDELCLAVLGCFWALLVFLGRENWLQELFEPLV